MAMRVLLIDDDPALGELLCRFLGGYGVETLCAGDGLGAAELVRREAPDIVILDVMLPGRDGFAVLADLRAASNVPVLMLTAKGEDQDRIVGLEMGADDYLAKPFNPRELLARLKAVLRRSTSRDPLAAGPSRIVCAGLALDPGNRLLEIEGDALELTAAESGLLAVLMRHAGRTLSREELMDQAFGRSYESFDRTIDVHVARLRAVLNRSPRHAGRIKTVWGAGYRFLED